MAQCPFCGLEQFEYVDVGIGSVPVAVNCCPLGPSLFEHYSDKATIAAAQMVADELGDMPHGEERFARANELLEKALT